MTDPTTTIEIRLPDNIMQNKNIIINITNNHDTSTDTTTPLNQKDNITSPNNKPNKDEKIKKRRTPQTPENIYKKIKNYLLTKVNDNQTMSENTIFTRIFSRKTINEHKKEMEDALKQLVDDGILTKIEKTTPKRGEVVTYIVHNDTLPEEDEDDDYDEDDMLEDIESMNVREIDDIVIDEAEGEE